MREAIVDQTVDARESVGLVEMINAKDRHVVAAALATEATWVVTNDKRGG